MTNRLFVLLTVVAIGSGAGINCAAEPSHGLDVSQLRPGARVEIRTASVIDLPGVVKMRLAHGSLETAPQGQIVAQSLQTLTVCPPGCTAPVVVPKPDTHLVAVVLGIASGLVHLELDSERHEVVVLPTTAIAAFKTMGPDDVLGARDRALVGKHVAVDVGTVVELWSDAKEGPPPSVRDVVIDGTPLTELRAAGQETPLLVPPPKSHLDGNVVAADSHTLIVRLLGRSQVVTVPRTAIDSLRVQHRRSHAGTGALIGAGVGLAAGLAVVIVANRPNHSDYEWQPVSAIGDVILLAVPAAGGAMIGAVAGGMTCTDHWERVDPRRLSIAVMPDPRRGIRGRSAVRF